MFIVSIIPKHYMKIYISFKHSRKIIIWSLNYTSVVTILTMSLNSISRHLDNYFIVNCHAMHNFLATTEVQTLEFYRVLSTSLELGGSL